MPFLWSGCLPQALVLKSWSQPVAPLGAEDPLRGGGLWRGSEVTRSGPSQGIVGAQSFHSLLLLCAPALLYCLATSPHHTHSHAVSTRPPAPVTETHNTSGPSMPPRYTMPGTEEQIAHCDRAISRTHLICGDRTKQGWLGTGKGMELSRLTDVSHCFKGVCPVPAHAFAKNGQLYNRSDHPTVSSI